MRAGDPLARIREVAGPELAERLEHLDRRRATLPSPPPPAPVPGAPTDYDVALAGGGLSLLLAPLLADAGARVVVLERSRAGAVHREWNASGAELAPLWTSGLFTEAEATELVLSRYRYGTCRWSGGGCYPVSGVLDHAVDAGALLARVRQRAEARGVEIRDGSAVVAEAAGPTAVRLRVHDAAGEHDLTARLLVDARGASSPYATADLVCPTVGGVLAGLDQDPTVGDILATTEGVEGGRQHLWEAFPGRPGETTVYLFYYAAAGDVGAGGLTELYARFFDVLPRYRGGEARLLRPTFGYIPGWSRLGPPPRTPSPRILLFGDAAARHSPLTFCGFGAMLRTFVPAAAAIAEALSRPRLDAPPALFPEEPIHAFTGALARILTRPPSDPDALNGLLDAAFAALHAMGEEHYAALLQDRMRPADFTRFLQATAARRPSVYAEALGRLGVAATARWGARVAGAVLRR